MIETKDLFEIGNTFASFFRLQWKPIVTEAIKKGQRIVVEKPREGMGKELVGELDKQADQLYRSFLEKKFPGLAILSEEGSTDIENKSGWILDEFDGTHNILAGFFSCGTMCALIENGEVILSAVFVLPHEFLLESGVYIAAKGEGAWRWKFSGPTRLRVSAQKNLKDAFLAYEGPTKKVLSSKLAEATKWGSRRHRSGMSSCTSGILVASSGIYPAGFDALISCGATLWDTVPLVLPVVEAGGRVTGFDGKPWSLENSSNLVFSNGHIHGQILDLLKGGE